MRLVSTKSNKAKTEDFGDDFARYTRGVDAIVSKTVGGQALRMKRAEAGLVAKERTAGHGHTAREKNFDRSVKPENLYAGGAEKFGAAGLRVGPAAESDNRAFFGLGSAAESGAELVRFDLAEGRLTEALKNLRNGETGGFLDAIVQIDESPGKLASEQSANSGLAGTHESGDAENRGAGGNPTRRRRSGHRKEARKPVSERLIALQDTNCTTVGREFDFGEAGAHRAEDAFGEFRGKPPDAVRIGLEESGGLVVDGAHGGLGLQIKGIVTGETHFHDPLAAPHRVKAGADEVAVKEDIARCGADIHVGQRGLEDLRAAADGIEFQLAGTLRTHERAAGGLDNNVAGDFLEMNVAGHTFQCHIAHDLFNVNQTVFGPELKLGFFRHRKLEAGFEVRALGGRIKNAGVDVDPVAHLLHVEPDLVRVLIGNDHNFLILGRLHFDAAIGDVLDDHNRTVFNRKMSLDTLPRSLRCRGRKKKGDDARCRQDAPSHRPGSHVS